MSFIFTRRKISLNSAVVLPSCRQHEGGRRLPRNRTQNTSAPLEDPSWVNVCLLPNWAGVCIGGYANGYSMLTDTHVGFGNITLGGTGCAAVGGLGVEVSGDLYAIRIANDPLLPNLDL